MPARSGEPWRGAASIQLIESLGNSRRCWATLRDSGDPVPPEPSGDGTDWEGSPGDSFVIRVEWSQVGITSNGTWGRIEVEARLPNGGGIIGTQWVISNPGNDGNIERTFHLDDDPVNNVAGTNRAGMVEIYLRVVREGQATGNHTADSRGASTGLAIGTTHNWARGKARARVVLSSHAVSNVSPGGTAPATFVFPDGTFTRAVLGDVWYRSATLELRHLNVSTQIRNEAGAGATGTQRDYSWDADIGATAKVLSDYPDNGNVTARVVTQDLVFTATATSPDQEYDWAASGHATGFSRIDANTLEDTSAFVSDPRITVFERSDPTIDGVSTPVVDAVVNFTFHTITGTFKLQNARGETLTNSLAAIDRDVLVKSRDIVAGVNQKQITPSVISPDAAGLYTLPSYTYNGPSSPSNRGTGPDGDTAAHDQVGRSKSLFVQIEGNGNSLYPTVESAQFLALSDLLRMDSHPQKTSTLVKGADPYSGEGENNFFTIGADAMFAFAYIGDVKGVGREMVTVGFQLYDPDSVKVPVTDPTRDTASGADAGWTTTAAKFNVLAPAGTWRSRVYVDVDSSGSGGNYGDGATSPNDPAALDQDVEFVSSYTADRSVAVHVDDEVAVHKQATIRVDYRRRDGTRVAFDADPSIRVYMVNANGTETEQVALTVMTKLTDQQAWEFLWTPSVEGVHMVEIRGDFQQSGIEHAVPVTVRKRWITGPDGTLIDRM